MVNPRLTNRSSNEALDNAIFLCEDWLGSLMLCVQAECSSDSAVKKINLNSG